VDNVGRLVAAPDSGLIVDRPLPLELRGPPFTIADGAWVGLSKSRMAASGLFRPTHGARIDTRPDTIHEIARVRHQPPAAGAGQRRTYIEITKGDVPDEARRHQKLRRLHRCLGC